MSRIRTVFRGHSGERSTLVRVVMSTMALSVPVVMTTLLFGNVGPKVAEAAEDSSQVPTPTVQGPVLPSSGISYLGSTTFDPSVVGYEQSEFFLSGSATAYKSSQPLTKDGKWHVTPQTSAPYTTRVVVYRPIDASKFDGTVVVEWLNVTGGIDAPAAWLNAHIQMIRDGMAFVGVDAQAGGIYGQAGSIAAKDGAGGIKQTNPTRYASLDHPGDSFSYSIYEQTGQALHADGSQLLGGLVPQHVIALGESQSAFRLVTYIDALQPLSPGVYDAYFVYSRGGDGADLSQSPQKTIPTPTPTYIRTDLRVPVFMFETESDLLGLGLPGRPSTRHPVHPRVGDGGDRPRRHLRPAVQPERHRERGSGHLGVRLHAQPAEGPHPGHRRLRCPNQRRFAHL